PRTNRSRTEKQPSSNSPKGRVGPNAPSNSPNGRVGSNEQSNYPIRRVGSTSLPSSHPRSSLLHEWIEPALVSSRSGSPLELYNLKTMTSSSFLPWVLPYRGPARSRCLLLVGLTTSSLFVFCSISVQRRRWTSRVSSGVRHLQSWHGLDLSLKVTLLVTCRIEGLIFVSEDKVLRFELVELFGALLQLLGIFI
ncbi:hypothetical protein IGI04_035731, partial [Brassica rapa subsp. trilocularis]